MLTVMLIVSWLLLFLGVFMYERLDHRMAALTTMLNHVLRTQQSIVSHLGVNPTIDPFEQEIRTLLESGKTYEAIVLYRSAKKASYKEAKAYVDSLQTV
jgi:hypothetical protein